jgi:hypothetical protein
MATKTSGYTVRAEVWTIKRNLPQPKAIAKITVRDQTGRFHGATNFRQKV